MSQHIWWDEVKSPEEFELELRLNYLRNVVGRGVLDRCRIEVDERCNMHQIAMAEAQVRRDLLRRVIQRA